MEKRGEEEGFTQGFLLLASSTFAYIIIRVLKDDY
jgi:hypothetical protein